MRWKRWASSSLASNLLIQAQFGVHTQPAHTRHRAKEVWAGEAGDRAATRRERAQTPAHRARLFQRVANCIVDSPWSGFCLTMRFFYLFSPVA